MHAKAFDFVRSHLADHPVDGLDVLEIGSYDVNGSVRPLCAGAGSYTGIDSRPGRGVDFVMSGANLPAGLEVDVVICCEVLEHTADAEAICSEACRVLRPGGRFIVTCATDPRAPHGINGGKVGRREYYQNVTPGRLRQWCATFVRVDATVRDGDLYAVAWKSVTGGLSV